jgi:uncharacterized membrane protein
MRTFSVGFDIVALNKVIPPAYSMAYGFMAQWVSFVTTSLLVLLLSAKKRIDEKPRALGYLVDPDFGRIGFLPKKAMMYTFIGGVFAGISTFSYYWLVGTSPDASAVLPYGQLAVIYLLIGDLMAEKDTPTIIEVQCIISIMLGVLLVGVSPQGFNLITLLVVLVPMNMSSAVLTYYQRKTKRYEIRPGLEVDTLNMRLWSLLFLNTVFTVLAIPSMDASSWQIMTVTFVPLLWITVGGSLTAFFSIVMYSRALGRGSMAIVNSLSSISVVLGIPLTLIGNLIVPGSFGTISADAFPWTLKIFGISLVMIGVIALQASDVRAIIVIRVKPQTGDLLPLLFDIKGVESVSGIAGDIDYLLSIKARSLAKTRSQILSRVQNVPGIESIHTLIVLKDYR